MDVRIWPGGIADRGGYACMPLRRNVAEGHAGWELTEC